MTELGFSFKRFMDEVLRSEPETLQSCRPVTPKQRAALEAAGSHCDDWSKVSISPDTDISCIRSCRFQGPVRICLPRGKLFGSTIRNCSLAGPVNIESTGMVSGYTLYPGCSIRFCGKVVWNCPPSFLKSFIQGGLETGERALPLLPTLDHRQAAWLASGKGRAEALELAAQLSKSEETIRGFIGSSAVIESCPAVENTLVLDGAKIDGATGVKGSILFPGSLVQDGALVRSSALQWNASADSMAFVDSSIIGESSTVEKHGKLQCSFLGADSVLGEGEITASIVGPLTGMHHQSLLIAAYWPGGRGNVGYGANVGSNHTSRLPDQEIRPGPGFFFGLSASVKFPSDFSKSPYSVIATGITTLPQKVEFPFSLICLPDIRPKGIPEGWMKLIPGWMLHSNLYAVLRSLWKYGNRKRSVHTRVDTDVFSDEVLEMIRDALARLQSSEDFTVPGCGKNFITPCDRLAGIQAYRKCLRFFELFQDLRAGTIDPSEKGELIDLISQARKAVTISRSRDLVRGTRIIEDYGTVHPPLDEDPFLQVFEEMARSMEAKLF